MSEYILILVMTVGGYSSTTSQAIMFPSQSACEAARKIAVEAFTAGWKDDGPHRRTAAVCVPRNTP